VNDTPETARTPNVLLLCGSRKPGPDRPRQRSASRELLRYARRGVRATGVPHTWLDLRDLDLPFWDGRRAPDLGCQDLDRLVDAVAGCRVLLLAAPAYWGALSGVVKNALDLLGGEPFAGVTVVPLVVGQDDASAWLGVGQLRTVMARLGATVTTTELVVGDPRALTDPTAVIRDAQRLGAYAGVLAGGGSPTAGATVPGGAGVGEAGAATTAGGTAVGESGPPATAGAAAPAGGGAA
jgi:NAD(P)H-dependent FMN reductase